MNHTTSPQNASPAVGGGSLRAIAVAAALVVGGFLAGTVLSLVLVTPLYLLKLGSPLVVVVAGVLSTQLGLLGVALWYTRRRVSVPIRTPSSRELAYAGGGVIVALAAATALMEVQSLVGVNSYESVMTAAVTAEPRILLVLAALSVLLVGPAEEYLFRGTVQWRLRQRFGPTASIVGASLLFSSVHLFNFTGDALSVLAALGFSFVVGLVLGWIYERTGNLVVPALAHAAYNASLFIFAYLELTGQI